MIKSLIHHGNSRALVIDKALLQAAGLDMPKATMFGEDLHPTIFDKAAAYLFHIICNHPFVDGNKRTGTMAALTFLRQNRLHILFTEEQMMPLEEPVVSTANGKATKDQIASFFKNCYTGPAFSEGVEGLSFDTANKK